MNKLRKVLYSAFIAVFVMALSLVAAACVGSKKYTLTFMDGETQITQITGKEGEEVTAPVAPDKNTEYFAGWCLDAGLTGNSVTVPSAMPAENITYYAKYANKAVITLDTDGGTLSSAAVYLKPGDDLYSVMQNYKPVKAGLTFGGWFRENGYALAEGTRVSGNLTLKAKYKVEYNVEIYVENLVGEGYSKNTDLSYTDLDFVGETPDFKDIDGLYINEGMAGEKPLGKLNADKSQNNFVYYLDRSEVNLTYFPTPKHNEGIKTVTVKYGAMVNIEANTYEAEGYRYYGWEDLDHNIYEDGEEIEMNGNINLYAVWDKACTDRFGGTDIIYVLSREEGKAILYREGLGEKKGNVTTASNGAVTFEFTTGTNEKIVGKIASDNTFAYYRQVTEGEMFYFCFDYAYGELAGNMMLELDGYLNATLTNLSTGIEIYGAYAPADEDGLYVFSVLEGANAGYEVYFKITTYTEGNTTRNVFIMRGNEYEYGAMPRATVRNNGYFGFSTSTVVELDGFGNATRQNSTGSGNYYYQFVNGNADLISIYELVEGQKREITRLSLIQFTNGITAFFEYDENLAGTYGSATGSLTLDGYYRATYNNIADGTSVTDSYTAQPSVTGGYIITFSLYGDKFIVNGDSLEVLDDVYGEYYWLNGGSFYYAPHLVIKSDGVAELYAYSQTGYSLAAIGKYVYNETTKYYTYTQEQLILSSAAETMPTEMVFTLDSESYSYGIYVMRTASINGSDNTYYTNYNNGGIALEISDSGLLTLFMGSEGFSGYWDEKEINKVYGEGKYYEITVIFETAESRSVETMYVLLDKTTHTFELLDLEPTYFNLMDEGRTLSQTEGLFLDGNGKVKLFTLEADGKTVKNFDGTYVVKSGGTAVNQNRPVYTVTVNGNTFDIITEVIGNYNFYFKASASVSGGQYTSADNSILLLDGFGYEAAYKDADNNIYIGEYYVITVASKKVVMFAAFDENGEITDTFVIDATGSTFSVRDDFSGSYFKTENGILEGSENYIELDGYGVVTFHNGSDTETGSYTVEDAIARKIIITKTDGSTLTVYLGAFNLGESSSIGVYAEKDEELANYYVSADWTVLYVDGTGNAKYTDKNGVTVDGDYMMVDDGLIYFESDNVSGLYAIDKTNKVISKVDNSQYYGNYYDNKLEPVILNSLGSYQNTTSIYTVNGNNITVYQLDGFRHFNKVEGTIAGNKITLGGKVYTLFTAETEITLTDANGSKLTFRPDEDNTPGAFTAQYKENGAASATNVTLIVGYDKENDTLIYNFGYAGYLGSFRERMLSVIYTVTSLDLNNNGFELKDRVSTQTFYDYNYMYASLTYLQMYQANQISYASYYQAMQQAQSYYGGRVNIVETYDYGTGKTSRTMSANLNAIKDQNAETLILDGAEYKNLGATQNGQVYRVEIKYDVDGSDYVITFLFNSFAYQQAQNTSFWAAQVMWYRANIKTVSNNGYDVKVYQYLAGNYNSDSVKENDVMNIVLSKGGEELTASALSENNGGYTYKVITGNFPGEYTVTLAKDGSGIVSSATVGVAAYTTVTLTAGTATLKYLVDNKGNFVALYSMEKDGKELSLVLNGYKTYVSGSNILEDESKMVLWYADETQGDANFFYVLTLDQDGNPVSNGLEECGYLTQKIDKSSASFYVLYNVNDGKPEIITAYYSDAGMIYQATATSFAEITLADESTPYYLNLYTNAGQFAYLATVDGDELVLDEVFYVNTADEAGNRVYYAHGGNSGVVYAVDTLYVRGYGFIRANEDAYAFEKAGADWKVTTPFNTYTVTITSQNGNYSVAVSSEAKQQTCEGATAEIKYVQNESGVLSGIQSIKVGADTYTEGIDYKAITNYAYFVTVNGNSFYLIFNGEKHEEASFEAATAKTLTTADGKYQVTVTYTKRGNINKVYDLYLVDGADKTLITSTLTAANGGAYEYATDKGALAGLYSVKIDGETLTVGYSEIKTATCSYSFTTSDNRELTRLFTFRYILNADGSALRLLVDMTVRETDANEYDFSANLTYSGASVLADGGYLILYSYGGNMRFYFYFNPADAENPLVYARTATLTLEAEGANPAYSISVLTDANFTTVYMINAMGIDSERQTLSNAVKNADETWSLYIATGDNAGKYTVTFGKNEDGELKIASVTKAGNEYKSVSGTITEGGDTLTITLYYLENAGERGGYTAVYTLTSNGASQSISFTVARMQDIGNGKYWMVCAYSSYYFHFVVSFDGTGSVAFASYYYYDTTVDGVTYRAYIVKDDDNNIYHVASFDVVNEFGEYETISDEVNNVAGNWVVTDKDGNAYTLVLDTDGKLTVTVTLQA